MRLCAVWLLHFDAYDRSAGSTARWLADTNSVVTSLAYFAALAASTGATLAATGFSIKVVTPASTQASPMSR